MRFAAWALAVAAMAGVAHAYPRPNAELPGDREPVRQAPITGYTLALIWMPEQCHSATGDGVEPRAASECANPAIRGRFTLHGLWPDGTGFDKWPQYCRPVPILTNREIAKGFAVTPSTQLLQHEWAKHGTCVEPSASAYFGAERRLFASLRFPNMTAVAPRRDLTASGFQQAFAAVNPGMTAGMMRLNVSSAGWLKEVWLCLDVVRRPRTCPADAGGAKPDQPIRVQAMS